MTKLLEKGIEAVRALPEDRQDMVGELLLNIAKNDPQYGLTADQLQDVKLSLAEADLPAFSASAQRLADFVSEHPVAHVFGTHIEQKAVPYLDYGRGTNYQPEEHALELTRAHIFELNEAFKSLSGTLKEVATPDFTIVARGAATAYPPAPSSE